MEKMLSMVLGKRGFDSRHFNGHGSWNAPPVNGEGTDQKMIAGR
jgi:hypothetical protein